VSRVSYAISAFDIYSETGVGGSSDKLCASSRGKTERASVIRLTGCKVSAGGHFRFV